MIITSGVMLEACLVYHNTVPAPNSGQQDSDGLRPMEDNASPQTNGPPEH